MTPPPYRGAPLPKPIAYFQPRGARGAQSNSSSSSPRSRRDRSPTRRIVAGANLVLGTPRRVDISSMLRNQPEISPRTRLFNVGHARHAEIVQKALSTHDDTARLRRFRQVLQEPAISQNERFQPHLDYMRTEHNVLATKAEGEETKRRLAARHEREHGKSIRQSHVEFLACLENKVAELAATRLQARLRGSFARLRLKKMKALAKMLAPPEEADVINPNGEVDLSHKLMWNSRFVWACQIEQMEGESSKHFLFLADIKPGTVAEKRGGRCVFESVMYDIQEFVPVVLGDGRVELELHFGVNTAERKDAPLGWTIRFCVLPGGVGSFAGTLESSFWGNRKVALLPVSSMSPSELAQYPDLVGKYYKSRST